MAFGHVILKKFHIDNPSDYFINYVRQYTDMPMLVCLEDYQDGHLKAGRFLRAADIDGALGQDNNPEWKIMAYSGENLVAPNGSIGFRLGRKRVAGI